MHVVWALKWAIAQADRGAIVHYVSAPILKHIRRSA
jgi:hypothetical protein